MGVERAESGEDGDDATCHFLALTFCTKASVQWSALDFSLGSTQPHCCVGIHP